MCERAGQQVGGGQAGREPVDSVHVTVEVLSYCHQGALEGGDRLTVHVAVTGYQVCSGGHKVTQATCIATVHHSTQ